MITCGPYILSESLGKGGYAIVKKAEHKETGQICALKIMKRTEGDELTYNIFESEVNVMKELSHQNIIQLLDFSYEAVWSHENGKEQNVYYLALELATGGELFDVVAETGRFSEEICRHYFHQMMDGLEYMWSTGYKHRDIKPENILLDSNFDLKFTDFGFASTESTSSLRKGTEGYLGPEAYLMDEFQTEQLDIFASGIVLFIMIARCPPFNSAKGNDPHYKLFVHKNDSFWAYHEKRLKSKFSKNFKLLINAMLTLDPQERPSIKEIRESDWFKECLPNIEDVKAEMWKRLESLHEDKE